MDAGTENGVIANMQKSFRWFHGDEMAGEKSVIIGTSPSNQVRNLISHGQINILISSPEPFFLATVNQALIVILMPVILLMTPLVNMYFVHVIICKAMVIHH